MTEKLETDRYYEVARCPICGDCCAVDAHIADSMRRAAEGRPGIDLVCTCHGRVTSMTLVEMIREAECLS